jgi:GNAT superfamily N-acetyltransferase
MRMETAFELSDEDISFVMNANILIRTANAGDETTIAQHRVGMFRDMGVLPDDLHGQMQDASVTWTQRMMDAGTYLGWLAYPEDEPTTIVGGVGLLIREAPPTVTRYGEASVRTGLQGLVINVYTEPAWRRQGVARRLMNAVLEEASRRQLINVVLHAAEDGRHLYETLGFVPTNEMRLS